MQGDDIGPGQQVIEPAGLARIAQWQLGHHVVEDDLHAQAFGQHGQLRANGAIAHNAQRLAANLKGVVGALLPATAVGHGVLFRNATQQQDGFSQHQLGHGAGVRIRSIEDHHTALTGGTQIDLIGTNAEAPCSDQLVRSGKYIGRELGARADADKVHIGNLGLQLLALQRAGQRFDIGVARVVQDFECGRVNSLEQQKLDLRFIQRCLAHDVASSPSNPYYSGFRISLQQLGASSGDERALPPLFCTSA